MNAVEEKPITASLPACLAPAAVYTIWLKLRQSQRVAMPALGQSLTSPNI